MFATQSMLQQRTVFEFRWHLYLRLQIRIMADFHSLRDSKLHYLSKIGFTKKNDTCVDINECVEMQITCPKHSKCNNTFGGYNCTCLDGFSSQEQLQCIDIDECSTKNRCAENEKCLNSVGSYNCTCKTGLRLD